MFSDDDTARSGLTDQPQEGLHSKSGVSEQVALVVKNLPATAGDVSNASSILGSGRSPEEGNGTLLQYSCLENPMDRGAWQATVHDIAKSRTGLRD